MSESKELYTVNSEAFVNTEYPTNGASYTVETTQEEMVEVTSAVVWAVVVWSIGMVAALGATIFFAISMKGDKDEDESDNECLLDEDSPKQNGKHGKDGL